MFQNLKQDQKLGILRNTDKKVRSKSVCILKIEYRLISGLTERTNDPKRGSWNADTFGYI